MTKCQILLVVLLVGLVTLVLLRILYTEGYNYFPISGRNVIIPQKVKEIELSPHLPTSNVVGENMITPQSDGIYVSVKTTISKHKTRLPPIILTWLQNVSPSQVHLVTDSSADKDDEILKKALDKGFNVIYANCSVGHERESLCCKSGVEFNQYYIEERKYSWYCHFDDDIYVNVPKLVSILSEHDPIQDRVYIGRWPRKKASMHPNKKSLRSLFPAHKKEVYRYATGATYCISKSLMAEVEEYLQGARFILNSRKMNLPEDMIVGFIIGAVLGYNLTNERSFNSQFNSMIIPKNSLKQQITVSYRAQATPMATTVTNSKRNTLSIPGALYSKVEDPTRFLSYHCFLYPNIKACKRRR